MGHSSTSPKTHKAKSVDDSDVLTKPGNASKRPVSAEYLKSKPVPKPKPNVKPRPQSMPPPKPSSPSSSDEEPTSPKSPVQKSKPTVPKKPASVRKLPDTKVADFEGDNPIQSVSGIGAPMTMTISVPTPDENQLPRVETDRSLAKGKRPPSRRKSDTKAILINYKHDVGDQMPNMNPTVQDDDGPEQNHIRSIENVTH